MAKELGIPYVELQMPGKDPVSPARAGFAGPPVWLIDTGSGHDLVSRADFPPWVLSQAVRAKSPLNLDTANGILRADMELPMQLAPFGVSISPLLLPCTPAVLSVGKRCMDEGYAFHWEPASMPVMITPSGCVVTLEVSGNVPYLPNVPCACPVFIGAPAAPLLPPP
jgi:hypothetical protein